MATDQERAVQKSFDRAMEQINKLQRAFREEGLLAKAVVDMGGNTKFNDIQDAMSNLYDALEDGHYDAFSGRSGASMHESLSLDKAKEYFFRDHLIPDGEFIGSYDAYKKEYNLTLKNPEIY